MGLKRFLTAGLIAAALTGAVSPAFAESKSTRSVQVSCTIPAQFEMAAIPNGKGQLILDLKTNLQNHNIVQTLVRTAFGARRLYTITER